MAQGIVAKIWNVTAGNSGRSATAQIASSIEYIENPEKASVSLTVTAGNMENELHYVTNEIKTLDGLYVGGRHISDFKNVTNEMMQVKEFYGKLNGRVATHGVVSLDAAESDPKNAGKLMLMLDEFLKEVFPAHQVVYAVHTNTDNLHIHFILNTVGLDGKKIHMDKKFMRQVFEPALNKLAIKYGFTPNSKWCKEAKQDEMPIVSRKIILREIIDKAIEQTDDIAAFVAYLRNKGLTVNVGKNISVEMDGMNRAMRIGELGSNYKMEQIVHRMATKLDPLVWKSIEAHSHYLPSKEMINFTPNKMKKYKDMSDEEKKSAVRLIRLKRNPWEESYKENWAIENMSKQLNYVGYVYELVHYYSNGIDSTKAAMEEILRQRKELSEEKKEIRENLKAYKPIIAIYEEMKKYMLKAYLYDAYGKTEYIEDFRKYKELSFRLEQIYGKTVEEVAGFIADQKSQLIYAAAQEQELSEQYKAIRKYAAEGGFEVRTDGLSFFKAVGHSEAVKDAREYNIYASDIRYISSKENDEITIRVMTTPETIDEKLVVATTITVFGKDGNTVKEVSSKDMSAKEFNEAIFDIADEYKMKDCKIHKKNTRNLQK